MKKLILLLSIVFIGCTDDNFYGSQEDLTGTWIQKSIELDDYGAINQDCEEIIIEPEGSSEWTDCDGDIESNLMFIGLDENMNFRIEEIEDDFTTFYIASFKGVNEIEIRKSVKIFDKYTRYTYRFKRQ